MCAQKMPAAGQFAWTAPHTYKEFYWVAYCRTYTLQDDTQKVQRKGKKNKKTTEDVEARRKQVMYVLRYGLCAPRLLKVSITSMLCQN